MKSIFDKKYFKTAGLHEDMFNKQEKLDLERIADEYHPMSAHHTKILVKIVSYRPTSIYDAFGKWLEVSNKGLDTRLLSSLTYIFGVELAEKVRDLNSKSISMGKRRSESYTQGYINSLKLLKEHNISWESLTDIQKQRTEKLLNKIKLHQTKYLDEILSWFIILNLNNYWGRYRRLNKKSRDLYSYVLRYGKIEGLRLYKLHSVNRSKHFPNKISYWVNQLNCDSITASEMVKIIQKQRNNKSVELTRGSSEYTVRSLSYWIKKGHSIEEAQQEVTRIQARAKPPEVVNRWLQTLNNKTSDEKFYINLKKGHSIESYIAKGLSYEESMRCSREFYSKRRNYSQISQKLFDMIKDQIGENGLYYKNLNYEYQVNRCNVDFFDKQSGTVVEFLGNFWHADPRKYTGSDLIYDKPAAFVWLDDKLRFNKIRNHIKVERLFIVWEDEFRFNPEETVKLITECLQYYRSEKDDNNAC